MIHGKKNNRKDLPEEQKLLMSMIWLEEKAVMVDSMLFTRTKTRQQLSVLLTMLEAELCQVLGYYGLQEKLVHEFFSFITYTSFPFSVNSDY